MLDEYYHIQNELTFFNILYNLYIKKIYFLYKECIFKDIYFILLYKYFIYILK